MRIFKHLAGRSEYQPWWEEALNLIEDLWEWARGLVGRRSSPTSRSEADLALAQAHIEHLARLAREDHR